MTMIHESKQFSLVNIAKLLKLVLLVSSHNGQQKCANYIPGRNHKIMPLGTPRDSIVNGNALREQPGRHENVTGPLNGPTTHG